MVLMVLEVVLVVLGVVLRQCSEQMFGTDVRNRQCSEQCSEPTKPSPDLPGGPAYAVVSSPPAWGGLRLLLRLLRLLLRLLRATS